ncbi:hypothetical protein ACS0TY_005788 [Phlomoides rotata]
MMESTILVLWCLISSPMITNGDDDMTKFLPPCNYSAIYNFGDSNSDTGGIAAAFYPPASPSGNTYFRRPAGRASDGRLIIDFIAENLGLQYLSPYLDSIGSNFAQGANFATGGATILRPKESWFENGVSPFPLEIQVEHFTQFKDRTSYFYNQGQNDVALGIQTLSYQQQQAAIAKIVSQFISQVRILYQRGARAFWIHNTGPIGCLPVTCVKVKDPIAGYLDENGCVKSQNEIALQFNNHLKGEIVKLRGELSDAALIYVDMYAAKYELISNAKNQGFKQAFEICCGYHGIGYDVWCGNKGNVNGSEVHAGSCPNVTSVISWDGVHYSEAANQWIATHILNGSLSDPPVGIARACHNRGPSL